MIPRDVLDRIGDRWTVAVLTEIGSGSLRYSEIHLRLPGCSQKMLTQTLRILEHDGYLIRTVYAQVPPRVDYRLTEQASSLLIALGHLEGWSRSHRRIPSAALRSA